MRAGIKNTATLGGEVQYSIVTDFYDTDNNHYDNAVLLDTNLFDGISPRNWSKALQDHIESRVKESTFIMPVMDENGNWQDLEFAKISDRIPTKSGNSKSALSELYWTSDNISKLSAVHIDEIISVSDASVPYHTVQNALHNHDWLDENGFLHRNANVINAKTGSIYQIAIDIAKADDGRMIAFALNGKTRKIGNVNVNSLSLRKEVQLQNTNLSINNNKSNAAESQAQNSAAMPASSLDTDAAYLSVAEKYRDGTATEAETEQLRQAVEAAAKKTGYSQKAFHGTLYGGFTVFNPNTTVLDRVSSAACCRPQAPFVL